MRDGVSRVLRPIIYDCPKEAKSCVRICKTLQLAPPAHRNLKHKRSSQIHSDSEGILRLPIRPTGLAGPGKQACLVEPHHHTWRKPRASRRQVIRRGGFRLSSGVSHRGGWLETSNAHHHPESRIQNRPLGPSKSPTSSGVCFVRTGRHVRPHRLTAIFSSSSSIHLHSSSSLCRFLRPQRIWNSFLHLLFIVISPSASCIPHIPRLYCF